MWLLDRDRDAKLRLTPFYGKKVPPYAILSHTWSIDPDDEITFADIKNQTYDKNGYKKLDFCLRQAARDGFEYCWVDTCCINHSNFTEVNYSINSMFRWYNNADICYVYLEDLSGTDIQASRWFTRGWTLQELLAPKRVHFFSHCGDFVGDKVSRIDDIHAKTGLPLSALRGAPLKDFSLDDKISWINGRETKYEEDMVYSLLGICGVTLIPNYGEQRIEAEARLREKVARSLVPVSNPSTAPGARNATVTLPFALPGAPIISTFTGRQDEILQIERALPLGTTREAATIHGLGGLGKTQLAIQYATLHRHDYTAVLWVNGRNEGTLQQSFTEIAGRIASAHPSLLALKSVLADGDSAQISQAVRRWLDEANNSRWLLIIDNVDEPEIPGVVDGLYDVHKFLPTTLHGHVLVTSRSSALRIGNQIRLQKLLSAQECIQILLSTSERPGIAQDPKTPELIHRLDGLPLAIAAAGAYFGQAQISVQEYLDDYDQSWSELHEDGPSLPEHQGRTLYTTWELSRRRILRRSPDAVRLLDIWAFFGGSDIWYELLLAGRAKAPEWFQYITKSRITFRKYMQTLCEHGLVEIQQQPVGYGMHTCVHDWIYASIKEQQAQAAGMAKLALICIAASVPQNTEPEYWLAQQRLISHADHLQKLSALLEFDLEAAECLDDLGRLYYDQGKFSMAEKTYATAIRTKAALVKDDHLSILSTKSSLGSVFREQSQWQQAEEKLQVVLEGYEKVLGPHHISTLEAASGLGLLYFRQDKLLLAEKTFAKALQGFEDLDEREHPSYLINTGYLGTVYKQQERFSKAEELYMVVLRAREATLDANHPLLLEVNTQLGDLYYCQNMHEKAEAVLNRAYIGYTNTLGPSNKLTLFSAYLLGKVYLFHGRAEEARNILEEVLAGLRRIFDPGRIEISRVLDLLGSYHSNLKQWSKAEQLYEQAYKESVSAQGPDHELSLRILDNLGWSYWGEGQLKQAEMSWIKSLKGIRARGFGYNNTLTLITLGNLYVLQGRLQQGQELFDEALAVSEFRLENNEALFGSENADTVRLACLLGDSYFRCAKYADAGSLFRRVYTSYGKLFGTEHAMTLNVLHEIARTLQGKGRYSEAAETFIEVLSRRLMALGLYHKDVLRTRLSLGELYSQLGQNEEAESMFEQLLEDCQKNPGPNDEMYLQVLMHHGRHLTMIRKRRHESEAMMISATAGMEKIWGLYHQDVLQFMHLLGWHYSVWKDFASEERWLVRVVKGYDNLAGPKCPDALKARRDLIVAYDEQGKYSEARRVQTLVNLLTPSSETARRRRHTI